MSAKESSAWRRDYGTPAGHKPASAPADRLGPIVGSSKTAVRFDRSPVAQLVERLTVNQEVAGSSPARGANYYREFCSAPTVSTDSCVEACAEAEAGSKLVRPSRRLTAARRGSGARRAERICRAREAWPRSPCSSLSVTPRMAAHDANVWRK